MVHDFPCPGIPRTKRCGLPRTLGRQSTTSASPTRSPRGTTSAPGAASGDPTGLSNGGSVSACRTSRSGGADLSELPSASVSGPRLASRFPSSRAVAPALLVTAGLTVGPLDFCLTSPLSPGTARLSDVGGVVGSVERNEGIDVGVSPLGGVPDVAAGAVSIAADGSTETKPAEARSCAVRNWMVASPTRMGGCGLPKILTTNPSRSDLSSRDSRTPTGRSSRTSSVGSGPPWSSHTVWTAQGRSAGLSQDGIAGAPGQVAAGRA